MYILRRKKNVFIFKIKSALLFYNVFLDKIITYEQL